MVASLSLIGSALAQTAPTAGSITLSPVVVVGVTPLLGSGIDRDKLPAAATVLTGSDLRRGGPADAARALG
ncbi:MAG: hypothetical protein HY060_01150, partial [Proteobacteria bacterium]|nr:hypothetical protein [Pseudomonadota bacterium]